MECRVLVENEIPQIELILTNDQRKLLEDFRANAVNVKANINSDIIPKRIQLAYSYVQQQAGESDTLSIIQLREIHKLLGLSGDFRSPVSLWCDKNNIGVNGYCPPTSDNLEILMQKYVKQHTTIENNGHPLEKICRAYFIFEQIHPFNDGNGRTGRAICAWLMFKYGYGFLAPYIEKKWGQENKQHAEAFKSDIHHYLAWSTHQEYLNGFYNKFFLYFLKEVMAILNQL